MGKKWKQWQILFSWAPESLWMVTAAMKLKDTCSLEEKQWHHLTDKGPYSQSYGFSSSHVHMWELDHKQGCTLKSWCYGAGEDFWESLGLQDQTSES